jgi:pyridoxal phosphate-dependent aminotransferase EpsN
MRQAWQNLDDFVTKRRRIFQRYFDALSKIDGINFMLEAPYGKGTRWLTTLTVDPSVTGVNRTQIIQALEKENIEARPVWKPMHMQPLFKDYEYISQNDEDISGKLFEEGLCLPSGSSLLEQDQDRILNIIMSLLEY